MRINILEARNRLSELIRAARAGEEVIIANRGKPVARLVALNEEEPSAPHGSGRAILGWLDANPAGMPGRSAAEIDADMAREREAWD